MRDKWAGDISQVQEGRVGVSGPGHGRALESEKLQQDVGLTEAACGVKRKGPVVVIAFLVFPQASY